MWNNLSMTERAQYIRLGIQNGITDLSFIKDTYNRYDNGGSTNQLVGPISQQNTERTDAIVADSIIKDLQRVANTEKGLGLAVDTDTAAKRRTGVFYQDNNGEWYRKNDDNTITRAQLGDDGYLHFTYNGKRYRSKEKRVKVTPVNYTQETLQSKMNQLGTKELNTQQDAEEFFKGKNKREISSIQEELFDQGLVDTSIKVRGKDKIKALQKKLIDKGYLKEVINGKNQLDGIVGKNTREAYKQYIKNQYVDGIAGEKTISDYLSYKSNNWNVKVSAQGIDGCAQWVTKKYEQANNGRSLQNGVISNAWQMPQNIINKGGTSIYNIYDKSFNNIKDVDELHRKTKEALNNNPVDYSQIKIGDIIGIYMPSSNMHKVALQDGTTKNTHIGIVTGFDDDGMPIVEHNIHQKVHRDRADNLKGSTKGQAKIATITRPKYINEGIHKQLEPDNTESKLYVEGTGSRGVSYDNNYTKQFLKAMASTSDKIGQLFPNADMDLLQELAIAVQKTETDFMTNKESDQKPSESSYYKNKLRSLVRSIRGDTDDNKSSDTAKFKLNTLLPYEQDFLGIHSLEDLNDPNKAGIASLYILAKNYDYLSRLSEANPEIGLTKERIANATILSYNQGMNKLQSLGYNPNTGYSDISKLLELDAISKPGSKVDDVTSTNYRFLPDFMIEGLKKLGMSFENPTYVGRANAARDKYVKRK